MILLCSTVPSMFSKSHLECSGQGLITPPVRGQLGAEDVGGPGLDQLPGVLGQDLRHLSLRPPPLRRVHAAPLLSVRLQVGGGARDHRSHGHVTRDEE